MYLNACSNIPVENGSPHVTKPLSTDLIVELRFTEVATLMPTAISMQQMTPEMAPLVISPVKTNPPPPTINFQSQCPVMQQNQLLVWPGSILFSKGSIFDRYQVHKINPQLGIWAISANSLQDYLVYDSARWISISTDGTVLLNVEKDIQTNNQKIIFYNLVSNDEVVFTEFYDNYLFMELWLNTYPLNRTISERIEENGIKETTYILNSMTRDVEKSIREIFLPNFAFNESESNRGLFHGYESIDPLRQLVLYTAIKNNNNGFEVRLFNIETGQILWQHDTQYLPSTVPQWSEDGNYVLFVVNMPNADGGWWKIIKLTRDGTIEEFPSQPFPFIEKGELIHYSLSPNGQYLFYVALETDISTLTKTHRAFIANLLTGEIKEICDSKATFITPVPAQDNEAGFWLPNNYFVYRSLIEQEDTLMHSLRILDVSSWTAQEIFKAEAGLGINVFGWTPLEFPLE